MKIGCYRPCKDQSQPFVEIIGVKTIFHDINHSEVVPLDVPGAIPLWYIIDAPHPLHYLMSEHRLWIRLPRGGEATDETGHYMTPIPWEEFEIEKDTRDHFQKLIEQYANQVTAKTV